MRGPCRRVRQSVERFRRGVEGLLATAVLVLSALVALAVCAVVVGLCVAGIRLGVSLAVGA